MIVIIYFLSYLVVPRTKESNVITIQSTSMKRLSFKQSPASII
jgi:hypothetical protein